VNTGRQRLGIGKAGTAAVSGVVLAGVILAPTLASALELTSPDLHDGNRMPPAFLETSCNGGNLSPPLAWSAAPAGTRSFAVTVYDPDAPKAGGWWHWLAFDIPATAARLERGAASGRLPAGSRQGRNDYGNPTYDGPCPPPGAPHHYVITLWALDAERLPVGSEGLAPAALTAQFKAHALAAARLTVTYGR